MFRIVEAAGFETVRTAVVPGFTFRNAGTQRTAEAWGVKSVMVTAGKPRGSRSPRIR